MGMLAHTKNKLEGSKSIARQDKEKVFKKF